MPTVVTFPPGAVEKGGVVVAGKVGSGAGGEEAVAAGVLVGREEGVGEREFDGGAGDEEGGGVVEAGTRDGLATGGAVGTIMGEEVAARGDDGFACLGLEGEELGKVGLEVEVVGIEEGDGMSTKAPGVGGANGAGGGADVGGGGAEFGDE